MTLRALVVTLAAAAALTACGSAPVTESDKAMTRAAEAIAGSSLSSAGVVHEHRVVVDSAENAEMRWMRLLVVCPPGERCEVAAPDGERYADLAEFVDESPLLAPGDKVLGHADMTSPGKPVRAESFTRQGFEWTWVALGGGLLVLAAAVVVIWTRRRRHAEGDELERKWEDPA